MGSRWRHCSALCCCERFLISPVPFMAHSRQPTLTLDQTECCLSACPSTVDTPFRRSSHCSVIWRSCDFLCSRYAFALHPLLIKYLNACLLQILPTMIVWFSSPRMTDSSRFLHWHRSSLLTMQTRTAARMVTVEMRQPKLTFWSSQVT